MRSQRPYVRWSRCPASRRLVRPRRTRGRVRSGVATRRLPGLHEAGRFREPRRLQVAHRVVASHAPVPADKSLVAARAIRAPWFARTPDRVRASRSRWSAAPVSPGGGPGHGGSRRHRRRVSVSPSTRCPRCWSADPGARLSSHRIGPRREIVRPALPRFRNLGARPWTQPFPETSISVSSAAVPQESPWPASWPLVQLVSPPSRAGAAGTTSLCRT